MFIIPVILCSLANQKAVVLMSLRSYKTKNATGLVLFNQDNFEFSKPRLLGFNEKLPFLSQKNVIFHLICSWESCLWAFFGLSFDSTFFFSNKYWFIVQVILPRATSLHACYTVLHVVRRIWFCHQFPSGATNFNILQDFKLEYVSIF